jgi:hypothetical protein
VALISCIECHRQISDSATSCPGCSTNEPKGVGCALCERQMRRSEGVTCKRIGGSPSSGFSIYDEVAHKDCIERYLTPPATLACPECGVRLAGINDSFTAIGLWQRNTGSSCPNCGADVFAGRSGNRGCCGAPFYPFQGEFDTGHGHLRYLAKVSEKKAGCFIATAAIEGGHHEDLLLLCHFRDHRLSSSKLGRMCIRLYYRLSPRLAAYLDRSRVARLVVRRCLILPAARLLAVRRRRNADSENRDSDRLAQ